MFERDPQPPKDAKNSKKAPHLPRTQKTALLKDKYPSQLNGLCLRGFKLEGVNKCISDIK